MRLLNTSTIQFREFIGSDIPDYAILSHTWGEGEVSFQDMQDGSAGEKAGFAKIKSCCVLAGRDGWQCVWVDTCCIDKSSSAELSEAINSMFEWYREATVCYAYLVDVPNTEADHHSKDSAFRRSRWFTRGWTLQELLAPGDLIFCDQNWEEIGTRSSFSRVISDVTGIRRSHMMDFENKKVNVAVKMSWASKRETTRIEDIAYCLMGLFGVHMPLLYGEGKNAFLRLQLEILKMSDDETIFAWDNQEISDATRYAQKFGLLAPSPSRFRHAGDIRQILFDADRPVYSMTNKGLRIELLLWREIELDRPEPKEAESDDEFDTTSEDEYKMMRMHLAPLNCTRHPKGHPIAIYLSTSTENVTESGTEFATRFPRGPQLTTMDMEFPSSNLKDEGRAIVNVKQVDLFEGWWDLPTSTVSLKIKYPSVLCKILGVYRFSMRWGGNSVHRISSWHELIPGEAVLDEINAYSGYAVFLKNSKKNGSEGFGVLASTSDGGNVTDIVVFDRTKTFAEITTSFREHIVREGHVPDRISRPLQQGGSVSVTLRRTGPRKGSLCIKFVSDITIDAEPRLRWPPLLNGDSDEEQEIDERRNAEN